MATVTRPIQVASSGRLIWWPIVDCWIGDDVTMDYIGDDVNLEPQRSFHFTDLWMLILIGLFEA